MQGAGKDLLSGAGFPEQEDGEGGLRSLFQVLEEGQDLPVLRQHPHALAFEAKPLLLRIAEALAFPRHGLETLEPTLQFQDTFTGGLFPQLGVGVEPS